MPGTEAVQNHHTGCVVIEGKGEGMPGKQAVKSYFKGVELDPHLHVACSNCAMAPMSKRKKGKSRKGKPPANPPKADHDGGAESLDINGVAADLTGSSGQGWTLGTTQRPFQWAAAFLDSPIVKKMNKGKRFTVTDISKATQYFGWEHEPGILEKLKAESPVVRFCADYEDKEDCKVATKVLSFIAGYPGYDHLMEDRAATYTTLKLPTPVEQVDYQFLQDLAALPKLLDCMEELRRNRIIKLARFPGPAAALLDGFHQFQRACNEFIDADKEARAVLRAAESALDAAKEQRLVAIHWMKEYLSRLESLMSRELSNKERASAREKHRSSPQLQEAYTEATFQEIRQAQKMGRSVAEDTSKFLHLDEDVSELASKTPRAREQVDQIMRGLAASIQQGDSAADAYRRICYSSFSSL
jgi:hypothetical protein